MKSTDSSDLNESGGRDEDGRLGTRIRSRLGMKRLKFLILFAIGLAAVVEGTIDSSDVLLARLVLDF